MIEDLNRLLEIDTSQQSHEDRPQTRPKRPREECIDSVSLIVISNRPKECVSTRVSSAEITGIMISSEESYASNQSRSMENPPDRPKWNFIGK
jgi:hypothetical protein